MSGLGTSREVMNNVGSGTARSTCKFPSSVGLRSQLIYVMPQGEDSPVVQVQPRWDWPLLLCEPKGGCGTTCMFGLIDCAHTSHSVVLNFQIPFGTNGALSTPADRYRIFYFMGQ